MVERPDRAGVLVVDEQPGQSTGPIPATQGVDPVGSIRVRKVSKTFGRPGGRSGHGGPGAVQKALDAVDLTIGRGEFVALVGASGCGKTTLLNMIAGLVTPTAGRVLVSGQPPRCPNLDIGYMFARHALLPWRSVRRNVELGLEVRGWSRADRQARAREMLGLMGLSRQERLYPSQLSQGMRQRVSLARTLAADPSIILMDEPFAALDARTKLGLQAEFTRIWEAGAESGGRDHKTVVFVTHDLQEATLLADRVIIMLPSPGRVALDRRIDLPRPRASGLAELMFTEQFRTFHHELFARLEGSLDNAARTTPR